MSTERIVNRVAQTPFQEVEEARLKLEPSALVDWSMSPAAVAAGHVAELPETEETLTVYQVPYSKDRTYEVPDHVGDTVKIMAPVEVPEVDGTPSPEIVEDFNGEQSFPDKGPTATVIGITAEDLLSSLRASVGSEDFKVFRSQIIRAFKHLGLDTRKFFGE